MFNLLSQTVGYIMNKKVVDDDKARKEQESTTTSSSYTGYSSYEPTRIKGETEEDFLTRSFNDIFK